MNVSYEWDVETVAACDMAFHAIGDIIEHDFCHDYQEARDKASVTPPEGFRYQVVLVRDNDQGRSWAYMEGDVLPSTFLDAYDKVTDSVPQRFHHEVRKAIG